MKRLSGVDRVFVFLFGSIAILFLAITVLFAYDGWVVGRWDRKIDALCAANGGNEVALRVYETVEAPDTPEYFSDTKPSRSFFIPERRKGATLGPQYPFVVETRVLEVLNEKKPSVVKFTERIVRVNDSKTLSERLGYQRSGGTFELWDPGEIRSCPDVHTKDRLDVNTFTNHPSHRLSEKK